MPTFSIMKTSMALRSLLIFTLMVHGSYSFFANTPSAIFTAPGSETHTSITENAILQAVYRHFQEVSNPSGQVLKPDTFKGETLSADDLLFTYYGFKYSGKNFKKSIDEVKDANSNTDFTLSTKDNPVYHFDAEMIRESNQLILAGRDEVLAHIREDNYALARKQLGEIFHTLQDFYSHSNWVEQGNTNIHPELAQPGKEISSIAEKNEPTCVDCNIVTGCTNNTIGTKLTTGYYGNEGPKPPGKCSHGGIFDTSQYASAKGGINKDGTSTIWSPHSRLHFTAAKLALDATISFIWNLRTDIGNKNFSRLFNLDLEISRTFVLDVKNIGQDTTMYTIISSIVKKCNSLGESEKCMLVPCNIPGYSGVPLVLTNPGQASEFLAKAQKMTGTITYDVSSGIQTALLNSPPGSIIFVFAHSPTNNQEQMDEIEYLFYDRKSSVSFILPIDALQSTTLNNFQAYEHLAQLAGGQTLLVEKVAINNIMSIAWNLTEVTTVNLLYATHSTGSATFPFNVDSMVNNITILVSNMSGISHVRLSDPNGRNQTNTIADGSLAIIQTTQYLVTARLKSPIPKGYWEIQISATGNYTVAVKGQSTVDFQYQFTILDNQTHPGLAILDCRPLADVPVTVSVTVFGLGVNSSLQFERVSLRGTDGENLQDLQLQPATNIGEFFTNMTSLPKQPFYVVLHGKDDKSQNIIERVRPRLNSVSDVLVQVESIGFLYPNQHYNLTFQITNFGKSKEFTVNAINDKNIEQTVNMSRVYLNKNESVYGKTTLITPRNIKAGTLVTITLVAKSTDEPNNFNFKILDTAIGSNGNSVSFNVVSFLTWTVYSAIVQTIYFYLLQY